MSEPIKPPTCACDAAPTLIFACSGAADVGRLADVAARELTASGVGKMFCLAGIGGRVSGILESTRAARAILALDGCPLDCAKKTLENAGFTEFAFVRLSDLGLVKGKTAVTEVTIAQVVGAGKACLAAALSEGESQ
ncbi:MAG: putative zinc-binding protein [Patescibacteria group bacterium]|nr:putative zinc-binding protein [Patescibacteria group bacterium]